MGGDDSQKLLPRRGVHSSPGRKPPAQLTKSTISLILAVGLSRGAPWTLGLWPQLQPAWVIFGKHRWVNSGARRSRHDEKSRLATFRRKNEGLSPCFHCWPDRLSAGPYK